MSEITVGLHGFSDRSANVLKLFMGRQFDWLQVLFNDDGLINIIDLDSVNAMQIWDSYIALEKEVPLIVVSVYEKKLANSIWLKKPLDVESLIQAIERVYADYKERKKQSLEEEKLRKAADEVVELEEEVEEELEEEVEEEVEEVERIASCFKSDVRSESMPTQKQPVLSESLDFESLEPSIDSEEPEQPKADIFEQRVYESNSLQGYSKNVPAPCVEIDAAHSFEEHRALQLYYGSRDDKYYTDDLNSPSNFYEANEFLQGVYIKALKLAEKEKKLIQLTGAGISLYINGEEDKVYTENRQSLLKNISFIRSVEDDFKITPLINSEDFESRKELLTAYTPRQLLWSLSLWSSRGRLPVGMSGDSLVSLKRWPNFTRLDITPYAMQVVALWFNRPTPINQTVTQLNLPYRVVYSIYSACYALGIVASNEVKLQARAAVNVAEKVSLPKKIFRAIFNKLG